MFIVFFVNSNSILLKLFQLKKPLELKQNIILKKSNNIYENIEDFLQENEYYRNKKLITISPAGLKGFYNLGTCVYIRENFDLENYIYSGVSAGSWNGLIMIYNKDPYKLAESLIKIASKNKESKTIYDLQIELKNELLTNYDESNFKLDKLFMGVASFQKDKMTSNVYSDFENLSDALDCAIASSHIPFVTGKYINKYYNYVSFDGGITSKKYLNIPPILRIQQSMWNYQYDEEEMFKPQDNNYKQLFLKGYNDAKKNKDYLKYILVK